jgi:hypothetical protein
MPNYVTVSIPEPLYRQARELARALFAFLR